MAKKKVEEVSFLEGLQEQTSVQEEVLEEIKKTPRMFSKEWDAYVMEQFTPDELEDGSPRVAGLRRVTQFLVGPIIKSGVRVYQCPNKDNDHHAVVSYQMDIFVLNGSHPLQNQELSLEDVSDVSRGNTKEPYVWHSTATAATKAEARILRKVLGIKAIAAEERFEKVAVYDEPVHFEGKATEPQLNVIDHIMRRIDVNGLVLLEQKGFKRGHELTEEAANDVTRRLNELLKDKIPTELKGYKENWK